MSFTQRGERLTRDMRHLGGVHALLLTDELVQRRPFEEELADRRQRAGVVADGSDLRTFGRSNNRC